MKKAIVIAALALAGCGSAAELKPAQGASLPVAPYGTTTRPTATALLTPTTQQRPTRNDEVLTTSEPRSGDEFDLPPSR